MKKKALKAAFPHTLPVMAGYLCLGIGFGILLESKGFHFIWAFFMSLIIFAGSMQYAAVGLLSGGVSFAYTAFMTVVIQIRHLFYGLSLTEKYKNTGKLKPLLIHELTDETYALICSCDPPKDVDANLFYLYISMLDHLYWITGSVIGALLGSMIHFDTRGIDFAMTSLFIVIFTDQWLNTKEHRPAIIGLLSSFVCLLAFGASNFIPPSMLGITVLLTIFRKTLEQNADRKTASTKETLEKEVTSDENF